MSKPEVIGSIEPSQTIPFAKLLRRHLVALQDRFNQDVNASVAEAFEEAKLDALLDWKPDFVKNAWISSHKPS